MIITDPTAGRATVLVRAVDEILGTHTFGTALSAAARRRAVPTAADPGAGSLANTNAPAATGVPSAVTGMGTQPSR